MIQNLNVISITDCCPDFFDSHFVQSSKMAYYRKEYNGKINHLSKNISEFLLKHLKSLETTWREKNIYLNISQIHANPRVPVLTVV